MYCPNDECPDFVRYGLRGEYLEPATTCPKCGTTLLPGSPPGTSEPPNAPSAPEPTVDEATGPFVTVASFLTEHEADLAISYLASNGIRALRRSDDCGGAHPGIGFSNRSWVLVPEEDADEAAALLDDAAPEEPQDDV